ncbi:LuxR family transcriptional regulator [Croceicoccus estronivorus]|uniref:helix-turn-helix transcriptional regulator n=1 Tax=Croceicoccus estronivorus TaxID=1172626 RepID=UPI0008307E11|nr:LuxR family transcriptional regulator [Croceicoccus estronivorus]OCC23955.1 LuxR family transcriptional regulator [Croceicoccus estronivorus]
MNGNVTSNRMKGRDRQVTLVAAIAVVQAIAATFFVADAIGDVAADGLSTHIVIEGLIAFALFAGVALGVWQVRIMLRLAQRRDEALAIASGALAEHIGHRFSEWGLTDAESDVALFALKGCDVAEIARLRGAAAGTVRAQLSRIYAKAGVTGQAGLVSLFFEDLLG